MASSVFWAVFEAPVVQTYTHVGIDAQTVCGLEIATEVRKITQFANATPEFPMCPNCTQIMDAARKLVGVIFTETNGK